MRRSLSVLALLAPVVVVGLGLSAAPSAAVPQVPAGGRVSVSSAEAQANGDSFAVDVSDDGRFVLFLSEASNLVPGDTNGVFDVFLRDNAAGTTTRVSIGDAEQQATGSSLEASLSDDGLLVAFGSSAPNLVAGDTNGVTDVFVRDRLAGTTTRVSLGDAEQQGDGGSQSGELSGDGTTVAFASDATNLVAGDTNGVRDIFLRDLAAGTTERVSVDSSEGQADGGSNVPRVNLDGSVVSFMSTATDLIGANDTNGVQDVFARRVGSGNTFRVSVGDSSQQGDAAAFSGDIDDSGSRFVFTSDATNLIAGDGNGTRDVFYRSVAFGDEGFERVSVDAGGGDSDGFSTNPAMTGDARFVAFGSRATDLVASDTNGSEDDVFVRDLLSGGTTLVNARPGVVLNGEAGDPHLTASGSVAFSSAATNQVPGDTNGAFDAFLGGEVCDGRVVTVDLNHGDTPTATADVILGTPGNDVVNGLGGGDRFCGGNGNDTFTGGAGNDRAFGGPGVDVLKGQDGNDRLDGAGGNDRLLGGNQNDALFGVAGDDTLEGGNGNDSLNGGVNRDTCKGQAGTDTGVACEVRTGFP